MLQPGGYLDSQTTDTQFFSDSEYVHASSNVTSGALEHDVDMSDSDWQPSQDDWQPSFSQDDYHRDSDAARLSRSRSLPFAAQSSAIRDPREILKYEDQRPEQGDSDETRDMLWTRLDQLVNGPDYGNGRTAPWFTLPTIRNRRPDVNYMHSMVELWRGRSEEESRMMLDHISAVRRLVGGSNYPPSILQGEFVQLANFLAHLFPMMVRAATRSDLVKMQKMVDVSQDLLTSMQILVDVETEARCEVNRETFNNNLEMKLETV
jgi:hypothetical protein